MKTPYFFILALCFGCEAPRVYPGADKRQNTQTARIEGTAVVNSAARGNAVLFLFDAARPPPPVGTGRPITFTLVPRESLFGSALAGEMGPFTAPFAFSLVPPGRYLIRGFVDADDDFIPWYGVTADTTRGDVGGAAVDLPSRVDRVIEVPVDEGGRPQAVLDVPVGFSDATAIPFDRPIFSVVGGMDSVTLTSQPVVIELASTPIEEGILTQLAPTFLVRLVDNDGDGMADDANGDGVADMWPRVVVRKIAEGTNPLLDENDLDKNGIIDAEGKDYAPEDGSPDLVVLAAGFDVSEYAASLVDANGRVKPSPTPIRRLKLVIRPRALDVSVPNAPKVLTTVPKGHYAITVIQQTGQTWRVPNELGLGVQGLPTVPSQQFGVVVP